MRHQNITKTKDQSILHLGPPFGLKTLLLGLKPLKLHGERLSVSWEVAFQTQKKKKKNSRASKALFTHPAFWSFSANNSSHLGWNQLSQPCQKDYHLQNYIIIYYIMSLLLSSPPSDPVYVLLRPTKNGYQSEVGNSTDTRTASRLACCWPCVPRTQQQKALAPWQGALLNTNSYGWDVGLDSKTP